MKDFFKIGIPLLLASVLIAFYIYNNIEPATEKKLTIATGRDTGVYFQYAQRYKLLLEKEGIDVKIVQTAGSIEALKLLNEKKVDIGFVQGGTASLDDKKNLQSIASIYFEPLWIFVRASTTEVKYLNELSKMRLSIGEVGSGTIALAQQLLAQSSVDIESSTIMNLNPNAAYKAFKNNKIDAFFTVLSPQSELIKEMLQDRDLKLVNLQRSAAIAKYFPFLKSYKINEGGIDLKENIPNSDIVLLTTTATLVTHKDVDDTLVRLVAIKVKEESQQGSFFPSIDYLEIPIHKDAAHYLLEGESFLEKFFPYWIASNLDRLKFLIIPLFTLMLPLLKGFVPIYRWRSRSKIYRWYRRVDEVSLDWENKTNKDKKSLIDDLEGLIDEIRSSTNVPLSFKGEYYTLQLHIDHLIERIKRKIV